MRDPIDVMRRSGYKDGLAQFPNKLSPTGDNPANGAKESVHSVEP